MKKGKLTIEQVRGIMREIETYAERELSAARGYEEHQHAAGELRGSKKVLHLVLLEFGLRLGAASEASFTTEFDAWWDAMDERIRFHLQRIQGERK